MNRRRALIAAKQYDPSILWQTKNRSFNGGNITTGVPLCKTDKDWTIAFDVDLTTSPTSGDASAYKLIRLINNAGNYYSVAFHKETSGATKYTIEYMTTKKQIGTVGTGRQRFVMTHTAGSGIMYCSYRHGNDAVETASVSKSFTAANANIVLGQSSGANQLPQGVINKAYIMSRVMTSTEINNFLGV